MLIELNKSHFKATQKSNFVHVELASPPRTLIQT